MSFIDSLNLTGGSLNVLQWLNILIWPLIAVGIIYAAYKILRFNITVHIHNPHTRLKDTDRGVIERDRKVQNKRKFILNRFNKDWHGDMIDESFFVPVKRPFGRIGIEVHMLRGLDGRLQPILPPTKSIEQTWSGMDPQDMVWGINEFRSGLDAVKNESQWDKLLPVVVPIIGFVIIAVIILVLFKEMTSIADALNNVAARLGDVANGNQVI